MFVRVNHDIPLITNREKSVSNSSYFSAMP
jgi:hypothetical protein